MKKVLFGICALALSAAAFGAQSSAISADNKAVVGLPVKLQANVVDGNDRLFIEGSSGGTYGSNLILDFGDLTDGQSGLAEATIKVYRGLDEDGERQPFGADVSLKIGKVDTDFEVGTPQTITLTSANNTQKKLESYLTLQSTIYDQGDSGTNSTLLTATMQATTETIETFKPTGATGDPKHVVGLYNGATTIYAKLGQ